MIGRLHFSRKAKIAVLAVMATLVTAGAGLVYLMRTRDISTSTGVLMVMTQRGGLCAPTADRPQGWVCDNSFRVFTDGRFEGHRPFTASEIAQLRGIIARTDFTAYEKNAAPQCPSFADGVDLGLSFPAKHPGKHFTLCLLNIPKDDDGFRAIVALLDKHEGR